MALAHCGKVVAEPRRQLCDEFAYRSRDGFDARKSSGGGTGCDPGSDAGGMRPTDKLLEEERLPFIVSHAVGAREIVFAGIARFETRTPRFKIGVRMPMLKLLHSR